MDSLLCLPTLEALRFYVRKILCDRVFLEPESTVIHESLIHQEGRVYGLLFRLKGSSGVERTAIWEAHAGRILFYSSRGDRFAETFLSKSPELPRSNETAA